MELFAVIGGAWIVGMVGYVALSNKTDTRKRRCNVKREVIRYKLANNAISEVTKKKR